MAANIFIVDIFGIKRYNYGGQIKYIFKKGKSFTMLKIFGGRVICDKQILDTCVYIDNGKIYAITDENLPYDRLIDAEGNYVSAGFIDTHVHGGGGADFMDGGVEPMRIAAKTHLMHGTTSICPTTLASSYATLKQALLDFKVFQKESGKGGVPNIVGMHFEGPYFSKNQAGAQPPQYIYPPKKEEYDELIGIADGAIVKWSFAPELEGAQEFTRALVQNNILPSLGHTDGTYDDVIKVYNEGARCLTHFYSGMSTITRVGGYRIPGVVEAGYLIDDMWVEVIGDGAHIPPILLKMIVKLKGVDRIVLVTDAMRGATMPDGESLLGRIGEGVKCIIEDGIAKMPDRTCFAGSVATTDRLVRTFYKNGVTSLAEAVWMVTNNPAVSLGLANKGRLCQGYDADVVLFDEDVNIKHVIVGSNQVF